MRGMIDEAIVSLVRSDERRCTRQPPIHVAASAPKIRNIPRKIVIPNGVGDKIHVHAAAEFARGYFPAMKPVDLRPVGNHKGASRQDNIGIAPDKAVAGAVPPGVPEDVAELCHVGAGRKEKRFQIKGQDALEQPSLSDAEPLVRTGADPLEGDARFDTGLERLKPARINRTIRR